MTFLEFVGIYQCVKWGFKVVGATAAVFVAVPLINARLQQMEKDPFMEFAPETEPQLPPKKLKTFGEWLHEVPPPGRVF